MSRRSRGYAPHLALLGLALVQLAVHAARHVDDEAAWRIALDPAAATDARIGALHRLANRATERDRRLGELIPAQLLAADDPRLREYALTVDLCKHHPGAPAGQPPPLQARYALAHPGAAWTPHHLRSFLLYRRKVGGDALGGQWRLTWDEVDWFTASLAGRPLPAAETLAEHFRARTDEGLELVRRRNGEEDR